MSDNANRMNRPHSVTLSAWLLAISNTSGLFLIGYTHPHASPALIQLTVLNKAIAYGLIYALWKGKNWARVLFIIGSVLSVLYLRYWNTPLFHFSVPTSRVVLITGLAASLFLIYCLNTSEARRFFKKEPQATQAASVS